MVGTIQTIALVVVSVMLFLVLLGYITGTARAFIRRRGNDESEDYAGPGPGEHRDIDPDAEELFDTSDGDSS